MKRPIKVRFNLTDSLCTVRFKAPLETDSAGREIVKDFIKVSKTTK